MMIFLLVYLCQFIQNLLIKYYFNIILYIWMKKLQKSQQKQIFYDSEHQEHQEGEILSSSSHLEEDEEEGQVLSHIEHENKESVDQIEGEVYDSSDQQRMQQQNRRRQILMKQRQEQVVKLANFSHEDLLKKALEDIERTNKRVVILRKKNQKLMDDIQKVRMTQQPYLITNNTHFRGSVNEYPLLTEDRSGRVIYHPNYSLKISEMRLGDFIQKNIKQQSSANYLNEVVKFQNYAYQQRKKRRQNIE